MKSYFVKFCEIMNMKEPDRLRYQDFSILYLSEAKKNSWFCISANLLPKLFSGMDVEFFPSSQKAFSKNILKVGTRESVI